MSVEVICSCSDLFAFFPNGTDNNDVTSRNENGRNDKNGQRDKCHVELPLPLMIKIDPSCKKSKDIDEKIDIVIKMTAIGGDNKVKIEEVIKLFTGKKEDPRQMMGAMFRMYDVDGNGYISKKELARFMQISDDYDDDKADFGTKMMVEMIMMMVDQDEDGKLNYEEFCKIEIKYLLLQKIGTLSK